MILAYYEILHTDAGTEFAEQLRKQIDSDPLLQQGTKPWSSPDLPPSTELYSLIVVVTEDLAGDSKLRQRVTKLEARGFPVIPVVPSVATYDFTSAPLPAIVRRNAVGLDGPEFFVSTLLHHSGLRHHGSGGKLMISYARIDGEDLAKGLCGGLEAAGFEVFLDTEKIEGGSRVQDRIKRAIEDADLVLLVDSQGSDASRWVAEELEMARAAHTPVLAVTRGRDGYHSFRAPHIPWPENGSVADVAETAVTAARRLLGRTATFRAWPGRSNS